MKRLIAVCLFITFLATGVGHYALLIGLKNKSGKEFSQRMEGDMYDLGGSMTIKVPLGLPYVTNSESYEPADGTYEDHGDVYQIIKKRIYRDTLYIVCQKDAQSTKINRAIESFVQSFAGDEDDGDKKSVLAKDYLSTQINITHLSEGWTSDNWGVLPKASFTNLYSPDISHPPATAA